MSFAVALLLMSSPGTAVVEPEAPRAVVTAQASATILAAERIDFDRPGKHSEHRTSPRKSPEGTTYIEFH